jgi:uncharacterized membrane protein YgdD (TMEM256/DUF423 family)
MNRVLAFVQFLIVGLGVFALHLMNRLQDLETLPLFIAQVGPQLARYGLWFLLVPVLWAVAAIAMEGKVSSKTISVIGIIVTVLLFLTLAVPLAFYLR